MLQVFGKADLEWTSALGLDGTPASSANIGIGFARCYLHVISV